MFPVKVVLFAVVIKFLLVVKVDFIAYHLWPKRKRKVDFINAMQYVWLGF